MKRFIEGEDRSQATWLTDDSVSAESLIGA